MIDKKSVLMIKSYKKIFVVIITFILIYFVVSTSLAFFNYTRTGATNTLSVGRISFNHTQDGKINLTNIFPTSLQKDENGNITNKSGIETIEITIEGDTDYSDGVEYLVSSVNTNITTSTGKVIPISLDINTINLGEEKNDYFNARKSKDKTMYKKLIGNTLIGDQMLLVGYIKPNTISGIIEGIQNGKITISAYLNAAIIGVSDTYDGTESDDMQTTNEWVDKRVILTTDEWNDISSTGISFQIKVEANEGIWVNGSLEEIMKTKNLDSMSNQPIIDNVASEFVTASTGINFGNISSNTNGNGIYMHAGTENDDYPIIYYRGDINDNNVIFGEHCWKAVRTTDTGGVKLLYNGNIVNNKRELVENDYGTPITNSGNFTFNSLDNSWNVTLEESINSTSPVEISFRVPSGSNYDMYISGTSTSRGYVHAGIYKNNEEINNSWGSYGRSYFARISLNELLSSDIVKISYYGNTTGDGNNTIKFKMIRSDKSLGLGCNNTEKDSEITIDGEKNFAFSGENLSNALAYTGYMYGEIYESRKESPQSNVYFGSDVTYSNNVYSLVDSKVGYDGDHHYTCNLPSIDGTCVNVRYYYYKGGNSYYYVLLSNGEKNVDVIEKSQYNIKDSNAKKNIEKWFQENLIDYVNQMEDTIWCNDRSIGNYGGWQLTGSSDYQSLTYSPSIRKSSKIVNLGCSKNDSFTVNSTRGNSMLKYPIALLTTDEIVLAGGMNDCVQAYYNNGDFFWLMSPNAFTANEASVSLFMRCGISTRISPNYHYALRPSISIIPGLAIVSGDGTVEKPYVIKNE